MSGLHFHALRVCERRADTDDAVVLGFDVPAALRQTFRFEPGQYLTLRRRHDGQDHRRSYSICSAAGEPLRVGVRRVPGGLFSGWVHESLRIGETPVFADERERTAHEIASQLLVNHRLSDELYAKGERVLGQTRLIELVATVGYYSLVSLTLNTFEVPLREGMTDPFPTLPG